MQVYRYNIDLIHKDEKYLRQRKSFDCAKGKRQHRIGESFFAENVRMKLLLFKSKYQV